MSGVNFRDLGGCRTTDGRAIRRGQVYRCAHLARLPEQSPLRSLRLRTLVTLQSRVEVSHLGPPEPGLREAARWEHIPIGDKWFERGEYIGGEGQAHLVLVTDFRDAWQAFFNLLAERDVYPLLFQCSAGRDRTGVGAAMLLEVLRVDRDHIVADFLESNVVFPDMLLHSRMLEPLFALIDESGGIDDFMYAVIGLAPAALEAIREHLLED